ncbi:bifunctional Delta(1)-pyrroline-2-carboxylate/Delta(1)-piperideine-2-carboxylate reductase [Methylobacterium planeticum]|uniref:Ornithine cyclodeaminase family protein n=1 Tax=Methylobacterium planeticum TaxID=2615211 RepID=A0A6N6MRE7_9HYPH|nr:ornithine cyclodeaminase family protein [Methylobacterium planeticum]KAB1073002.1 ornithine cyclodeaminase family protein [Methylobacterium planeticum]
MIPFYDADAVHAALDYPSLVAALRDAFAMAAIEAPVRTAYEVGTPSAPGRLLAMPAWRRGEALGVKLVNVFPRNADRGLGAVHAVYVLFDGTTGAPRALIDGEALTNRRTAAASALASTYLSRADSGVLTLVGTGRLAPELALAHAAVRPIRRVLVWGRSIDKAQTVAARLCRRGLSAERTSDLPAAVAAADIVSCATVSSEPLVLGHQVRPGTHIDLVGAFTPAMRESDDAVILASRVYVDTYAGALAEAGDLIQPIAAGIWSEDRVCGDLRELCTRTRCGRAGDDEVTLFKSVGAALEDLVAATLVLERGRGSELPA